MVFRPATPGFVVTLVATILLLVVSFSVPWFKSVYFLKAHATIDNVTADFTFGVLGYCSTISGKTTCTSAKVGYQFDPNALLGDKISFAQIPTLVVKWITYVLILHIVALILAAISAVFGLLAHCREMSMTCFSSCIAGFAAFVAFLAFVFDIALFFLAKGRINQVNKGSATIGNGVWLTLAAWLLLVFSGCFYTFGRCCLSRRPRSSSKAGNWSNNNWNNPEAGPGPQGAYSQPTPLAAVKAKADKKGRKQEGGLPAFEEYDVAKPLTRHGNEAQYLEEEEEVEPYHDHPGAKAAGVASAGAAVGAAAVGANGVRRQATGGYVQAPLGTRAVDQYNNVAATANSYPPQPQSPPIPQGNRLSPGLQAAMSAVPVGGFVGGYAPQHTQSPPPASHDQYLSTGGAYGHSQYSSGQEYGHGAGGTSYYSTYENPVPQTDAYGMPTHGQQYSTGYTPPQHTDAYGSPYGEHPSSAFPSSAMMPVVGSYQTSPPHQQRSQTLGGGGYGESSVPELARPETVHSSYFPYPNSNQPHSPSPINTNVARSGGSTSATSPSRLSAGPMPRGPRAARNSVSDDMHTMNTEPPAYDGDSHHLPGSWNPEKH